MKEHCKRLKHGRQVYKKARSQPGYGVECIVVMWLPKGALVRLPLRSPSALRKAIRKHGSYEDCKNRANRAEVKRIFTIGTRKRLQRAFTRYGQFCYEVGKTVVPSYFDHDVGTECSGGIHFFQTRARAREYSL